tara:strand:+ start:290 stop:427 length:138 start_codon:yes stop_codon:yes gene_type:complete
MSKKSENADIRRDEDYQAIDLDMRTLNTLSTYEWIGEIEREIQEN